MAYFIFRFTNTDVFFETLKSGTKRLSVKMDKIWHRGIIKYVQKKGLAPKDVYADIVATLGDDAPVLSTVKKWAAEFKRVGRALKMTQGLVVQHQQQPKKTSTVFTT